MTKDKSKRGYKSGGEFEMLKEVQTDQEMEWYLELLGTQQADGHFIGKVIVADYFHIPEKELAKVISQIHGLGGDLKEKALVTFLAIKALKQDPDVYALSKRAVKKAEKWMMNYAPGMMIANIEVGEYLKNNYKLSL